MTECLHVEFRCLIKGRPRFSPFKEHSVSFEDLEPSKLERFWKLFLPQRFSDGLTFFFKRNDFDFLVTEDYNAAILLGFLSRIFGRRAQHIVKELYLDETVLSSFAKRSIFRFCLAKADRVVVNSSSEIHAYAEFLQINDGRIVFIPWPSNISLPPAPPPDRGYVFAAGRSMRDWETLFEGARHFDVPFIVVASRSSIAHLAPPSNVQVFCDLSHAQYLEYLSGATAVVLPLSRTVRSSGQAVALEAMAMRKPLLVADTPGILDYVTDERNAMLYCAGDANSLVVQLRRLLTDKELRVRLSEGGATSIRTRFCKEVYAREFCQLMADALRSSSRT